MQNTKFRLGQTVWCLLCGKGKVVEIDSSDPTYSVYVQFEESGELLWYTHDGKYTTLGNRTLFFSEPQVIAETEPVFKPKLVGKVVAVWCNSVENFVETGQVMEEFEDVIALDSGSAYPKDYVKYTFHEVTPQPITFD